ncbi:uncharacterized protein SCHCODRAFT_02623084 [Schizophyllum commune H4-8]|nr:uncharacterized protein SCHCODRAFT_02623084 [Schizophyllum commune H4-8]KAI5893896.1 hypothetical protein SCHCODRAFT_02623084 [Schizophyllum commune H4-8]
MKVSAHIRARRLRASSLELPFHPLSPHIRAMKAVRNMLGLPPSGDAARALEWDKAVHSGTLYEGTLYMSRFKRDPVEFRLVRDAVLVMKPGGKPMKDYKRPIPLLLLSVSTYDSGPECGITIVCPGRKPLTLYTEDKDAQAEWTLRITTQAGELVSTTPLRVKKLASNGFFTTVRCSFLWQQGQRLYVGTPDGVYEFDMQNVGKPRKVLTLDGVRQIGVTMDVFLCVIHKEVLAAPIPAITLEKPELFQRYAERIAVDSEFFVTGRCLGRPMVCTVKAGHTKASARVFDLVPAKNSHSLRGLTEIVMANTSLSSAQFLDNKLCAITYEGFQTIDIETLELQHLLDVMGDDRVRFAREVGVDSLDLFQVPGRILACFNYCAIWIDRNGHMMGNTKILWQGKPTSFALFGPYIIAAEPSFIEVHDAETGDLVQVIRGENIRIVPVERGLDPRQNRLVILSGDRLSEIFL